MLGRGWLEVGNLIVYGIRWVSVLINKFLINVIGYYFEVSFIFVIICG